MNSDKKASLDLNVLSCANCTHFKRLKYHKDLCPDESDQKGGTCKLLKEVLSMTNSELWSSDGLHVQESFGCKLHQLK